MVYKLGGYIKMICKYPIRNYIQSSQFLLYYALDDLSRFTEEGDEMKCSAEIKKSCLRYFYFIKIEMTFFRNENCEHLLIRHIMHE